MYKLSSRRVNCRTSMVNFSAQLLLVAGIVLAPRTAFSVVGDCSSEMEVKMQALRERTKTQNCGVNFPFPSPATEKPEVYGKMNMGDPIFRCSEVNECSITASGFSSEITTSEIPFIFDSNSDGVFVMVRMSAPKQQSIQVFVPFDEEFIISHVCSSRRSFICVGTRRVEFLRQSEEEVGNGEVRYH